MSALMKSCNFTKAFHFTTLCKCAIFDTLWPEGTGVFLQADLLSLTVTKAGADPVNVMFLC